MSATDNSLKLQSFLDSTVMHLVTDLSDMAFPQTQQRIVADRAAELALHQAAISDAVRSGLLDQPNAPLNMLADGDSWFNYPLDEDGRWGAGLKYFGIIDRLKQLPSQPLILNLAHWGDATTTSVGCSRVERIIDAVNNEANGSFDAVLFSGGGDDLVGDQFCIWLNDAVTVGGDAQKAFNPAFNLILEIVQASYAQLVDLKNKLGRLGIKVPIYYHGYDFAIPSGKGVCGQGPWLKPSLDLRGWIDPAKPNQGADIVKTALTQFADSLQKQFPLGNKDNVYYVPTQGTLTKDEWANELHPTEAGWESLAEKFREAIAKQFPGRI